MARRRPAPARTGPYWPVQGQRILSIWFALDDVTVEPSGVEVRKRSHRWGNEYRPIDSGGDTEACKVLPGATLPASDALWNGPGSTRHAVYGDMGAGDCRLHHGLTIHGAPGNAGSTRASPRLCNALERRRPGVRAA